MLPDEGRYVGVAWEMLRSGDWLTPTLNGLPFFHKPPLFYWVTASSLSLFGANEIAARAAPLLGAWLGAMSLYAFVCRWCSVRTARMAVLVLLVQPLFLIGGQFANLDMLVAGCITATILLAAHAMLLKEHDLPYRWPLAGAYAMAGMGVLAKGLIGGALPAMTILVWLLATKRWRMLRPLIWFPGLLLFVLVTAPWFAVMQWKFADFLNYFFVVQHFQRFTGGGFNNVLPWWFYPAILLFFHLLWLPWIYRMFTPKYLAMSRPDPVRALMWIWFLVIVVFFSIPKSKLLGYILPAVPPLAFLLADSFTATLNSSPRLRRWWFLSAGLAAVLSLGAVAWLATHPTKSTRELAKVLRSQHAPHEPVFMLNHYDYDLPFYAKLNDPVVVVDDWKSAESSVDDNWRKEFSDAGRFAPSKARVSLMESTQLPAALCQAPVSWVIGSRAQSTSYPFVEAARDVFSDKDAVLWRVDRADPRMLSLLRCEGKPNAGSANK